MCPAGRLCFKALREEAMSLGPSELETLARARSDLRMGLAIALTGLEEAGLAPAAR